MGPSGCQLLGARPGAPLVNTLPDAFDFANAGTLDEKPEARLFTHLNLNLNLNLNRGADEQWVDCPKGALVTAHANAIVNMPHGPDLQNPSWHFDAGAPSVEIQSPRSSL